MITLKLTNAEYNTLMAILGFCIKRDLGEDTDDEYQRLLDTPTKRLERLFAKLDEAEVS